MATHEEPAPQSTAVPAVDELKLENLSLNQSSASLSSDRASSHRLSGSSQKNDQADEPLKRDASLPSAQPQAQPPAAWPPATPMTRPAMPNGYPAGPASYRPAPPQGYYNMPPPPGPNYYYPTAQMTPRPQYAPSPQMGYSQPGPPPGTPMMRPPPGTPMMMGYGQPQPPPALDNAYMPDSSVLAASQAGRRTPSSQFPPPSMENLQRFRAEAMQSNDPRAMLDLVKYMMLVMPVVLANTEKDPKKHRKIKETMYAEAQRIAKKLANNGVGKTGYGDAQFYLADCYGSGKLGLAIDADKAFSLYLQGSKQSHPGCTYRVAVCYEVGAGTKKDNGHAIQFYRKAANLGDVRAMHKLSMILLRGTLGQQRNPREGMSWLERAAGLVDEDYPQPLHDLGVAFEKEGVPSVIPDPNYARDLFTTAAQYGYAPSQFKLGLAYENGFLNCPIDPRRSIAWYSKAAEQGDLEAELALSGWYLTGADGILQQNDSEAYLWARKAADRGYAKAEYAVGYYTETGVGVKPNLDEARRWYMRSAAQNNRRAMQRLTELKKHGGMQQRRKHTRDPQGRPNEKDSDCTIM
ncbi:HCP-like protein [Hesseltinella vesiculosa]|uniref:HCP-like protein n=1 Tax=Hesseltinella vesiculosa TaxID=101127 RepID=A0A1X2GXZ2_9FUNG|nr:HCP-like protein [Hesseltinella vesiculosa]